MNETVSLVAPVIEQALSCTPDIALVIAEKARLSRHTAREAILNAAGPANVVFLMVDGHARALAYALDGRLILVEEFRKGDFFGDIAAYGAGLSYEEVVAGDAVTAGQFTTSVFVGLMESYSCVAMAVMRTLSRRLTETSRKMVEIATISAPGRAYAELLRLGREAGDWRIVPAPVNSELAMTVQTTRETVSRAVSVLERKGIISREDGVLTIIAPHRLEELVY